MQTSLLGGEVRQVLNDNGLGQYATALVDDGGYDSIDVLKQQDKPTLIDIAISAGMKPGHQLKFVGLFLTQDPVATGVEVRTSEPAADRNRGGMSVDLFGNAPVPAMQNMERDTAPSLPQVSNRTEQDAIARAADVWETGMVTLALPASECVKIQRLQSCGVEVPLETQLTVKLSQAVAADKPGTFTKADLENLHQHSHFGQIFDDAMIAYLQSRGAGRPPADNPFDLIVGEAFAQARGRAEEQTADQGVLNYRARFDLPMTAHASHQCIHECGCEDSGTLPGYDPTDWQGRLSKESYDKLSAEIAEAYQGSFNNACCVWSLNGCLLCCIPAACEDSCSREQNTQSVLDKYREALGRKGIQMELAARISVIGRCSSATVAHKLVVSIRPIGN